MRYLEKEYRSAGGIINKESRAAPSGIDDINNNHSQSIDVVIVDSEYHFNTGLRPPNQLHPWGVVVMYSSFSSRYAFVVIRRCIQPNRLRLLVMVRMGALSALLLHLRCRWGCWWKEILLRLVVTWHRAGGESGLVWGSDVASWAKGEMSGDGAEGDKRRAEGEDVDGRR